MAACITSVAAASSTPAMKSSSSSVDLDDMKKSLDCMKTDEIFELIEKAINIAASQHPKELLQQRDRIVNMLLNSQINTTDHTTHDDQKRIVNDADNLRGDSPTIDEAEQFLAEVISFDPAKLFEEISDLDDDIEANDNKHLNQNEHKISSTERKEVSISPCSSSLTDENNSERCSKTHNNETNSKPKISLSCKVTSSNSTKQDQNQQKVCLASLDAASLQAKLENSKRKLIERQQQEEKKRRKIQLIEPLALPKQEQQQITKQSLFKPKRKLGVMIRR